MTSIALVVLLGLLAAAAVSTAAGLWADGQLGRAEVTSLPARLLELSGRSRVVAITAAVIVAIAAVVTGRELWKLLAPTGSGFANRADVGRELSPAAARRSAKVTRPDLKGVLAIAKTPLHELAIAQHETFYGARLWLPLENGTGVIAPQQSGKSLTVLIHHILNSAGFVLTTSTKPDLMLRTAGLVDRKGRPVTVLDLTGQIRWPNRVRWNPLSGCSTLKAARRRAEAFMASSGSAATDDGSNHQFFQERATTVLTALILAANLGGRSLQDFVAWCNSTNDTKPEQILQSFPEFTAQEQELRFARTITRETKDGIWLSLQAGIACLNDQTVLDQCLPRDGETAFDPREWIERRGVVYVIGSERDAASQAALVTAFVEFVMQVCQETALANGARYGYERVAPAAQFVLDEVTNICPLPGLPETLSDSAGRGVVVHWAIQSLSQAVKRWGREGAKTLLDNTTSLTIFGALKDEDTLQWASAISGERVTERESRSRHSLFDTSAPTGSTTPHDEQTLTPGKIRQLPRGRALLIMRHLPPLIVRLRPAWKQRWWKQASADAEQIRAGSYQVQAAPGPNAPVLQTSGGVAAIAR